MSKVIKTILHYYCFDLNTETGQSEYSTLIKKLMGMGLKCFSSHSPEHRKFYNKIRDLDCEAVELDCKHVFDNQWNTTENSGDLRVFDWAETVKFKQTNIKEGMWLEQTEEMLDVRSHTYECKFCGHQEYLDVYHAIGEFCDKCLGSEYLTEAYLHLTRLRPVNAPDSARPPLKGVELRARTEQWVEAQTIAKKVRVQQKRDRDLEKLTKRYEEKIAAAEAEYQGTLWLWNNHINTDNCIYHSHTNEFCFGFKRPLSSKEQHRFEELLKEFPYKFKFKTV